MNHPPFNPLVADIAPPPIPEVMGWARDYDGALGPLIDMSQAVPGYPPHPDLLAWLGEMAASPAYAGYGDIEGEPALRSAYAKWSGAIYGADITPADIHITAGCNQAFFAAAMALAGPGDMVLLTNPNYFNQATTLAMLGIATRTVTCDPANRFLPDPAKIADAIDERVRALAIVTPNNPTGAVYPPDLLAEIYAICRRRGVWLIIDETYRDFLPPGSGAPHGLFAQPQWRDTLIGLYSFSKSFCIPGHRLGAVTGGAPVIAQIAKVMDNLQICAPRAPQAAVVRAIPALGEWREANRQVIAERATALQAALAQRAGWSIGAIGAYFAFVRHPFGKLTSTEAARRLARDTGVLTIPGACFGDGLDDYLRIAFANVDKATIAKLADRLAS
ncbi:MAG: aminotransferase [Phyllobacteriaceae bacterium]|nr:aminotransferase [Phyllobacteriaceae bacterium]